MAGRAEVSAAERRALIARSAAPVRYSVFPRRRPRRQDRRIQAAGNLP